jgi:hypothetical protein
MYKLCQFRKGISAFKALMFPLLIVIIVAIIYIAGYANLDSTERTLIVLGGVVFAAIILLGALFD